MADLNSIAQGQAAARRVSRPFPLGVWNSIPGVPEVPGTANVSVDAPGLSGVEIHFETAPGVWASEPLSESAAGIHHGRVSGLGYGSRYGFWPLGKELPGEPGSFQLLLDPYGRGIDEAPGADGGAPLFFSVHVDPSYDWGQSRRPRIPWRDTVIYEAHVRGQTLLHPGIPEELRGTYAGMAHPVMVEYLQDLGITSVELLPVQFHADEEHLRQLGLTNYWGYNTLGFFAPQVSYATKEAQAAGPKAVQDEFKDMVRSLHDAGLEVLLDVVYNHTAEGTKDRPALCWRGLGEEQYYRHDGEGRYLDTTGCGNTLDFSQPRVIQMAVDSLRYWVSEYHVDGFRFDLAPALCRGADGHFDSRHPFLMAVAGDPVLAGSKLIAEPWDIGPGGWQTGNFPPGWADWNDRFRDTVRDFWLRDQAALAAGGTGGSVARLAASLAGSADLFAGSGRTSLASINLVTAHDGFTLADLTAYDHKHNEANAEDNRDGSNENRSYNHGVEGPTADEQVAARRAQSARNLMTTLLMSLGVPMITAGDELGRTQHGNNNAYCQDTPLAWLDWHLDADGLRMLETTRTLLRLRRDFLASQPYRYPAEPREASLLWFDAEGQPMTPEKWEDPGCRVLQLLAGSSFSGLKGLLVLNGTLEDTEVKLPDAQTLRASGMDGEHHQVYQLMLSTAAEPAERTGSRTRGGEKDILPANSISLYRA
ncbi:glycogen debranching protein GlgX [Arthrobacter jiangjiafuii]|uniref:Glycogen debranching protein GlgX n=1 Tax=Arthrobacter jiangjiafuii TaxID=2817475 RepID=A0A975M5W8_9MICC|nr:glycogen debranching protein GlgX [Arthrobacter jiangjiafuii]MBP3045160.1 glycogen debranching protein GlgX [Arthrobacter jiangjiafuii]QWC10525.1 glycogen debranching protein GlgX [Arthrobacter jiangjiafuii]